MCEYIEPDILLMEQFIGGLNNADMTDEILRKVTALENIEEAKSEHELSWVCRVEVQRAFSVLNNIKESKDFDAIWKNIQRQACGVTCGDRCKYCSTWYLQKEVWGMWQRHSLQGI